MSPPSALRLALAAASLHAAATHANIFTVGPDGTHAGLQAAVTEASVTGGSEHEIRIRAASFDDLPFIDYNAAKTLTITGGWDDTYSTRNDDPEATRFTVPAAVDGRPLWIQAGAGSISLAGVTLHGGHGIVSGGGIELRASGDGRVVLSDCVVRDNTVETEFSASGAGISAYARENGMLQIARCLVVGNVALGGSSAAAAGIYLGLEDTAHAIVEDNRVEGNLVGLSTGTSGQLQAAGAMISAYEDSSVDVLRNRIVDNHIESGIDSPTPNYGLQLDAGFLQPDGDGRVSARGNVIRGNSTDVATGFGAHVLIATSNFGSVDFGDNEISEGRGGNVALQVQVLAATAAAHLTNLTIADNDGTGLRVNYGPPGSAIGSLYNSIVHGNSQPDEELPPWLVDGSNLIGPNPHFNASAAGNYTLAAGSPAVDAGDDDPPGGLGTFDAGGGARVIGAAPDIGAHERGSMTLFADGFE